jgi:hypothetical protein
LYTQILKKILHEFDSLYAALIQRLGLRLGSTRQQNRWLSRLEMRKRKPGESAVALADVLRQMSQRAYVDLDARAQ